jgi:tetratricopeptide (TPR) repeat protein
VPITITTLQDLEVTGETALLDLDLTYFTGLQLSSLDYRPGTASLLNFLRALKRKRIEAVMATINIASIDQATPLDIRYYAGVIEEIFNDPSLLDGALPEKYSMMISAEKMLSEGRYGEAAAVYAGLARNHPRDAGIHFAHALSLGFLDKGEECREAMLRAYEIDTAYLKGFFQLARVLGANGHIGAGEALLDTPDLYKTLSAIEMDYQRGLFYVQSGLYVEAVKLLENVAGKRPEDFAIRTVLYHAYEQMGEERKMNEALTELLRIDRDRVAREMPWVFKKLGDISWNHHRDHFAAYWYRQYLELVHDDPDSLRMQEVVEEYKDFDLRSVKDEKGP